MSASFWLEAGVNNDDGSGAATATNNQGGTTGGGGLTFNRRSTVSLAGGWGELRLGRDYTPQFWNLTIFDPFGTNGVGTTATLAGRLVTEPDAHGPCLQQHRLLPAGQPGWLLRPGPALPWREREQRRRRQQERRQWLRRAPRLRCRPVQRRAGPEPHRPIGRAHRAKCHQNNIGGQWDFGMAKLMGQFTWDKVDFDVGARR